MIDGVRIQPDLALKRVEALFRYDGHGRLTSINEWNGGAAPRFFLMRTIDGVICRFRADLPGTQGYRLPGLGVGGGVRLYPGPGDDCTQEHSIHARV